jgi:hypothetical protein
MLRTAETFKTRPLLVVVTSGAHREAPIPWHLPENRHTNFHRGVSIGEFEGQFFEHLSCAR